MESLNADQVKKALECCVSSTGSDACNGCPFNDGTCYKDSNALPRNALALIESQEERIEAYRQELAEVRVALAEANCDKKRLTEEAEGLKQCMEHEHASFMETFGELDDECKRLTEENDKLHASCTELAQCCTKLEMLYKIERKRVDTVKADTVRKMQERTEKHATNGYPRKVRLDVIDQIAKEMLEGDNEN